MRLKIVVFITLFISCALQAQESVYPYYPTKTNGKWQLIAPYDSLLPAFEFDSVVVEHAKPNVFNYVVKKEKGYSVFLNTPEPKVALEHGVDSCFIFHRYLLFREKNTWNAIEMIFLEQENKVWRERVKMLGRVDQFWKEDDQLFFWNNGLQGLLYGDYFFPPVQQHIRLFENHYLTKNWMQATCFLASDGEKVGLYYGIQKTLPIAYDVIEWEQHGWLRFWVNDPDGGYWDYVQPSGKILHTNGADVRIYSTDEYKLYSLDHQTSYLTGNNFSIGGKYEDYFRLNNDYVAFKSNGKIGVLNTVGKIVLPAQFEQVEFLGEAEFRVLQKNGWQVLDQLGNAITADHFDYVRKLTYSFLELEGFPFDKFSYQREKHFYLVNKQRNFGVVHGKKTIVPIAYKSIYDLGWAFLCKNEYYSLYLTNGSSVTTEEYPEFNIELQGICVFKRFDGYYDLYSLAGKLNSEPILRYECVAGAIKMYGKSRVEVVVFNEENPATIDERVTFPAENSVNVKDGAIKFHTWTSIPDDVEIEETQLTGKYNLRSRINFHQLSNDNWIEYIGRDDYMVFGVKEHLKSNAVLPFEKEIPVYFEGHYVSGNDLSARREQIVHSTVLQNHGGTSWSSEDLITTKAGHRNWYLPDANHFQSSTQHISIIQYDHPGAIFSENSDSLWFEKGDLAQIGVYDYWREWNAYGNFGPINGDWSLVLDPRKRVFTSNSKTTVFPKGEAKVNPFLFNKDWKSVRLATDLFAYENPIVYAENFESTTFIVPHHKDSSIIDRYATIQAVEGLPFVVESKVPRFGLIHPLEPNVLFIPDAPENKNVAFAHGRKILRNGQSAQLLTVNDSLILSAQGSIEPHKEGCFLIRTGEKIAIVDRNGNLKLEMTNGKLIPHSYFTIVQFDDRVDFRLNKTLYVQFSAPGIYRSYDNAEWLQVEHNGMKTWYSVGGEIIDTAASSISVVDGKWLVSKAKKGYMVRAISCSKWMTFKVEPQFFGNLCYVKQGEMFLVYDDSSNLVVSKNEKLNRLRTFEHFIQFDRKDVAIIFCKDGSVVYRGIRLKSLVEVGDDLYAEAKDTTIVLKASSIVRSTFPASAMFDPRLQLNNERQVKLPALQGLITLDGTELIPSLYDEVIVLSENEVLLKTGKHYRLYSIAEKGFLDKIEQ